MILPNTFTSIPDGFLYENQLTTVTIPSGITTIGDFAFAENQLSDLIMPSGLLTIGQDAFYDNQLTSISIPDSVTSLENNVFKNNLLTNVSLGNGITSIGELCFQNNQITSLTIPNSVTSIEDGAFENNLLTGIIIPSSVTLIEGNVFLDNPLNSVTSLAATPAIISTGGEDTFGDRINIDLIIPPGTTGVYVTDTGALWTGFNSVTEDPALSTSDVELESEVSVFNKNLELQIITSNTTQLKDYEIYNMAGVKVKEGIENTFIISALASGVYILKLNLDKGVSIKKFVR